MNSPLQLLKVQIHAPFRFRGYLYVLMLPQFLIMPIAYSQVPTIVPPPGHVLGGGTNSLGSIALSKAITFDEATVLRGLKFPIDHEKFSISIVKREEDIEKSFGLNFSAAARASAIIPVDGIPVPVNAGASGYFNLLNKLKEHKNAIYIVAGYEAIQEAPRIDKFKPLELTESAKKILSDNTCSGIIDFYRNFGTHILSSPVYGVRFGFIYSFIFEETITSEDIAFGGDGNIGISLPTEILDLVGSGDISAQAKLDAAIKTAQKTTYFHLEIESYADGIADIPGFNLSDTTPEGFKLNIGVVRAFLSNADAIKNPIAYQASFLPYESISEVSHAININNSGACPVAIKLPPDLLLCIGEQDDFFNHAYNTWLNNKYNIRELEKQITLSQTIPGLIDIPFEEYSQDKLKRINDAKLDIVFKQQEISRLINKCNESLKAVTECPNPEECDSLLLDALSSTSSDITPDRTHKGLGSWDSLSGISLKRDAFPVKFPLDPSTGYSPIALQSQKTLPDGSVITRWYYEKYNLYANVNRIGIPCFYLAVGDFTDFHEGCPGALEARHMGSLDLYSDPYDSNKKKPKLFVDDPTVIGKGVVRIIDIENGTLLQDGFPDSRLNIIFFNDFGQIENVFKQKDCNGNPIGQPYRLILNLSPAENGTLYNGQNISITDRFHIKTQILPSIPKGNNYSITLKASANAGIESVEWMVNTKPAWLKLLNDGHFSGIAPSMAGDFELSVTAIIQGTGIKDTKIYTIKVTDDCNDVIDQLRRQAYGELRADLNCDGSVNLGDIVNLLWHLFGGSRLPAVDNDSGCPY